MAIPTPDDLGRLIEKADERFAAFISVCAFAGLRRGEASALRVSDVEFLRRELRVTRQLQWTADGRMELRPPKYGSERTVYVPDGLITILAEYVRMHWPGDAPDRYLFPGSRDANLPAHAATVGRSWPLACASAKVKFRLHDCRHFFASGLIHEGCDVVTVQRALGHSSPSITLDPTVLWPDVSDRTRNAAASLVEQVFGTVADGLRTEGPN